jgi:hypothetical protein
MRVRLMLQTCRFVCVCSRLVLTTCQRLELTSSSSSPSAHHHCITAELLIFTCFSKYNISSFLLLLLLLNVNVCVHFNEYCVSLHVETIR